MSDFLDLLETIRAEDASMSRLFGDAGSSVRTLRRDDPRYQRSLAEAAELVTGVYTGRTPIYRMQEAMSTSDFPLLFGDILDRQMLGAYQEWPTVWSQVARRGSVRDFRTVRRFVTDGSEGILDEVPQGKEYPESAVSEGKYDYSVKKFGRRIPFLWEAFVNDDLDALRQAPNRLAKAARVSEERFATELYVDSTGPDATFFSSGNANKITTGGTGISADKLKAGLTKLRSQKDSDGNPIYPGKVRLVVPPDLYVDALTIVSATQIQVAPGATSGQQPVAPTWVTKLVSEVVENPWLPIVDSTAGTTTWYLFADPGVGRPAMEVGFLRGHDAPELFMKTPNATRVGGGAVAAEDGDFETDGINYKVRHVFGGTLLDPKAAVAYVGA